MKKLLCLLISILLIAACSLEKDHHSEEQEKSVYTLPDPDHGLLQSPVNIMSSETANSQHQITFNFDAHINKVENLGHTVQLDFEPGSTIAADGITYEFKQLHFHTPSEHRIDGMTFPMEMHVVNLYTDPQNPENKKYLVAGFLFKMGAENLLIKEFINNIPEKEDEVSDLEENIVHLSDLSYGITASDLNECYHYKGSLTTPPYTEAVEWYVFKHIYTASQEQIQTINTIEGNNARQIQALFGRQINLEQEVL